MSDIEKVVEAATKLLPEAYSDSLSGAMKQIGLIGEDALKTFRLALFPLQYTAALQDRLARYIDETVRRVPKERLLAPQQSMALQLCEKLRVFSEEEEFRYLYMRLLSRMIDRERVGEAHPAFINLVAQLAPDEVTVIRQLASPIDLGMTGRVMVSVRTAERRDLTYAEAKARLDERGIDNTQTDSLLRLCVVPEELSQPELFFVFLEHLISLGVVEFSNESALSHYARMAGKSYPPLEFHCIQLSKFGTLFYRACVAAEV